jgi:hypothetical protein
VRRGGGRKAGGQIKNSFIKVTLCILAAGWVPVKPRAACLLELSESDTG